MAKIKKNKRRSQDQAPRKIKRKVTLNTLNKAKNPRSTVVLRAGIEPTTCRFSAYRSTTELPEHSSAYTKKKIAKELVLIIKQAIHKNIKCFQVRLIKWSNL